MLPVNQGQELFNVDAGADDSEASGGNGHIAITLAGSDVELSNPMIWFPGVRAYQPRGADAALRFVAIDGHDAVLLSDLFIAIKYALPRETWDRRELFLRKHPIGGGAARQAASG